MNDSDTPGSRLRLARKQIGMSAERLAERVGISASAVRNQENGTNGFSATRAAEYSEVLGVAAEWLLYGRGGEPSARIPSPLPSAPISMTANGDGTARLELDITLPFAKALRILAIVQEAEGE